MEIIIGLVAGFYLGYKVCDFYHKHAINDILNDMGITPEMRKEMAEHCKQEMAKMEAAINQIRVKIEQHQGQFYAFRADNDQFLGQSTDRATLLDMIKAKLGAEAVIDKA